MSWGKQRQPRVWGKLRELHVSGKQRQPNVRGETASTPCLVGETASTPSKDNLGDKALTPCTEDCLGGNIDIVQKQSGR